jgi:ribosomal protein S18 acetylase RimI-like enzyme
MNHDYKVIGFRAVDQPNICQEYIAGHTKILTDYGIKNITSNNNAWTKNKDIYCLALMNQDNKLLGGIRIQLANGSFPLPIEDAIGHMDDTIYSVVKQYALNGGIGELSGLWVDNSLKGLGIGWYMVRAAIASSSQLNFKTMIGICGDVTLKMFKNVGFVIDKSLGENGQFLYPNETLIAHAVGILNATTLNEASKYDKEIMSSLRKNFIQKRSEKDRNIEVNISYNLIYPEIIPLEYSIKNLSINDN